MRATSEGENEVNILMSSCFKKDRILISVSVFIITISLVTATAYYHCTCSVHFIHTMWFQLYVRFSKIFFFFFEQVNQEHTFKFFSYAATHYLYVYFYFQINRSLTFQWHECHRLSWDIREYLSRSWPYWEAHDAALVIIL